MKVTKVKPSYKGKRPNLISQRKQSVRSVKKSKYYCTDGPLDNSYLYMTTPGTFAFTLFGMKGFYNLEMKWCEL